MMLDIAKPSDAVGASIVTTKPVAEFGGAGGVFTVQCFDKDGSLKWEEKTHNLVTNAGLQDMNNKYFKGSSYTAAWYLGLVTGPGASNTYAAGDTLGTHAGWSEDTNYSGDRKSMTFGTPTTADPSVIDNSGSPSSFSINGTSTIGGAFLCSAATGTTGVLFSVASFASPGDRSVVSGDTLNVTYTFSLDAA